jgi:hypothetical protein
MTKVDLFDLEEKRKKLYPTYFFSKFFVYSIFLSFIIIFAYVVLSEFIPSIQNKGWIVAVIFIYLVISIVMTGVLTKKVLNFQMEVLKVISDDITKYAYPSETIEFRIDIGLSLVDAVCADFFIVTDVFTSSNLLSGTYKNVDFKMSDFSFTSNIDSLESSPNIASKGQLLILNFKESLTEASLKISDKGFFMLKKETISPTKTDNPTFNKSFKVYSENSNIDLLTPKLMKSILELKKLFKGKLYLRFIGNTCYVLLLNFKELIKIPLNKPFGKDLIEKQIPKFAIPKNVIDGILNNI